LPTKFQSRLEAEKESKILGGSGCWAWFIEMSPERLKQTYRGFKHGLLAQGGSTAISYGVRQVRMVRWLHYATAAASSLRRMQNQRVML
jgi:hypothetical protein